MTWLTRFAKWRSSGDYLILPDLPGHPAREEGVEALVFQNSLFLDHLKFRLELDSDQEVREYLASLRRQNIPRYRSLGMQAARFTHSLSSPFRGPSSAQEAFRLLATPAKPEHRALLGLLLAGLTIPQAVRLRKQDVDLARGMVHACTVKGGRALALPIPSKVLPHLDLLIKCSAGPPEEFLFPLPGKPSQHLPEEEARAIVEKAKRKAGFRGAAI